MVRLTSLQVYNSIFNLTEKNNNFEFFTDNFDEFPFEEIKEGLEQVLSISDITPYYLQHETIGPRFIEAQKELGLEKSSIDGYIILIIDYARSPFRDFGSYLRIVVGLNEDNIQLILKQNSSHFITCELLPGIHSFEDISQAVYTMGDHEGTIQLEYDDVSMKTKLILIGFRRAFGTLKFDEMSFFILFWVISRFGIINLLMQFMLLVKVYIFVIRF